MALLWVAYPMQVVAKSAKPIPVMLLGVLLGRKSYTLQKYMFVLLIVIGVILFMFKDGKTSNAPLENEGLGQLLLILSLTMDGLTGAVQVFNYNLNVSKITNLKPLLPRNECVSTVLHRPST